MADSISLSRIVSVQPRFSRSISLTRDWDRDDAFDGYIFTPSGQDALRRFAEALTGDSPSRVWTVTGPYGTGKSAFALFAAHTLGKPTRSGQAARSILKATSPSLWKKLFAASGPLQRNSLCPVLVSGSRTNLETAIAAALHRGLMAFGVTPPRSLSRRLDEVAALNQSRDRVTTLMSVFEESLTLLKSKKGCGLFLVIDELGKFLEHAASHPDEGDLFVLQALAEMATRASQPFLIVTILHQSVERYAAHVSVSRRQEWAKIQGRFEDIAFEETTEQLIRLLAEAIDHAGPQDAQRRLERYGTELAKEAWTLGYRPGILEQEEFNSLVAWCCPLHPTVTVLLAPLFKRLAQNERSLFAFLTSGELFALQQFLIEGTIGKVIPTYCLDRLYDYVTTALGSALYSQYRGRYWAEVQSVLERLHKADPLEIRVAKSIGLVQALGYAAGVPASKDFLRFALRDYASNRLIDAAIENLEQRSIIVYRRHADSYALWEGSDVNIESRMDEARRAIDPARQLTQYLADLAPPDPLVARRHSYCTGTLRYFETRYASETTLAEALSAPVGSADGRLIYCLPLTTEERKTMESMLKACQTPTAIAALPSEISDLKETCIELACLQWVAENTPELTGDATARRELRARRAGVEQALTLQIRQLFMPSQGSSCRWFHRGESHSFQSPRLFNEFLSTVCYDVYPHTPQWRNELINRRSLSSSAAAARRNLIQAMIERSDVEALGIEGTPPERSMYESILAVSGMHRCEGNAWGFFPPKRKPDPALAEVWKELETFLRSAEDRHRPVTDLFSVLQAPPYGLKEGVLPVLLATVLLFHDQDVALYEHRTFVPSLTTPVFERMIRSPQHFDIQYCRIAGPRALVFSKYAAMLASATGQAADDEPTLLKVVRPLIRFVRGLAEYVGQSQRVSAIARTVYSVLKEARQPDQLLFTDLPNACGVPPFGTRGTPRQDVVDGYFGALRASFAELQQAYPRLQADVGQLIVEAFRLTGPLPQARRELTQRAKLVSELAVDQRLRAFLVNVLETDPDDDMWVEAIAALLTDKPMRKWNDEDRARFEASIALTARTFTHFHALAFEMEQKGAPILDGDDRALRVGVTVPCEQEVERVVRVPAKFADQAAQVRSSIRDVLATSDFLKDPELSAAVLAQVVRELLTQ